MDREEILFTKEHSWARIEDEDTVSIGLSEFAVEELGEVTFVELPSIGEEVSQMEVIASVESLRDTMEVYSPVSGEIVEVNEMLIDNPSLLSEDPYGDGWIAIIRMHDPDELQRLMPGEEYEDYLEALKAEIEEHDEEI
ncbi:glycine cleavage system H protein [Thermosulfidibacter takaii ABI70S6]|uniref:Glycine cleavage system H protein n=1 Tax=Thermosulfidibacter takaii (strain DSM 17441 / JCM 13301 / NBRC 103674 / ABI70S6) TaxID=1298851 RepID=A0A0S3QSG0_THET7|nr:glycine cleavage system protein GcvH [Thermosulfidibacter takaii]BAT71245.1 glycine cleavage system H protein [Thermosulfidibacter takaii ABI70S6]